MHAKVGHLNETYMCNSGTKEKYDNSAFVDERESSNLIDKNKCISNDAKEKGDAPSHNGIATSHHLTLRKALRDVINSQSFWWYCRNDHTRMSEFLATGCNMATWDQDDLLAALFDDAVADTSDPRGNLIFDDESWASIDLGVGHKLKSNDDNLKELRKIIKQAIADRDQYEDRVTVIPFTGDDDDVALWL